MAFEKGDPRINRSGRPKGNIIREKLSGLLETNIEQFFKEVEAMKPGRMKSEILIELLKLVVPKQREISAEIETNPGPEIDLSLATDEELAELEKMAIKQEEITKKLLERQYAPVIIQTGIPLSSSEDQVQM